MSEEWATLGQTAQQNTRPCSASLVSWWKRVWACLCFGFVVCFFAPTLSFASDVEEALPADEGIFSLDEGWQFRFGNSPHHGIRGFDWAAAPATANEGWKNLEQLRLLERPAREKFLWERVRLPGGIWENPTLAVQGVAHVFELYVNGKLIFTNADAGVTHNRVLGTPWYLIPLPPQYKGKMAVFRIYSRSDEIGLFGDVRIGPRHALFLQIVSDAFRDSWAVVGALCCALAALMCAAFKARWRISLVLGLISFLTAVTFLSVLPLRLLLMGDGGLWQNIRLLSLVALWSGISLWVYELSHRKQRFFLWMGTAYSGLFGILFLLLLLGTRRMSAGLVPLDILVAVQTVMLVRIFFQKEHNAAMERATFGIFCLLCIVAVGLPAYLLPGGTLYGVVPFRVQNALIFCALCYALVQHAIVIFNDIKDREAKAILASRLLVGTQELASRRDILPAAHCVAEFMVKEISVSAVANVVLYLRTHRVVQGVNCFQYAPVASSGRLVEMPVWGNMDTAWAAVAEEMLDRAGPTLNSARVILVPLVSRGKKIGILSVDSYQHEVLLAHDRELLVGMGRFLAIVIENLQESAEALFALKRDAERNYARTLQRFFVPALPKIPGLQLVNRVRGAGEPGKDWLAHFFDPETKSLRIYFGEARGRSFPAALLTALVSGAVCAQEAAWASGLAPRFSSHERLDFMAVLLNKLLRNLGREHCVMGMTLLSLDLESGELTVLAAGLGSIFLSKNAGVVKEVAFHAHSLGVSDAPSFELRQILLDAGDVLFLHAGTLLDTTTAEHGRFTEKNLKALLKKSRDPSELQTLVLDAARGIWHNTPQVDDVGTMLLRWQGPMSQFVDVPPVESAS